MTKEYKGSCLCGGIQFSVNGFSKQVANCHCSMCRKFHGSAFGTLVSVNDLKWFKGESLIKEYTAVNGTIRSFCKECGSSLGFRIKNAPIEQIEMAIATFDTEIPVKVDAQIFTKYKANWCELQDDLPIYTEERVT